MRFALFNNNAGWLPSHFADGRGVMDITGVYLAHGKGFEK
jgi:hypothetical protein